MLKSRLAKWLVIGALVAAVVAVSAVSVGVVSVAAQELGPDDDNDGFLGRFGSRLGGMMGFGGRFGGRNDELLADKLGITVDELAAAREAAHEAAIAQAVENGDLTQEEADLLLARQSLRDAVDPRALMADVLGITEDELNDKPMYQWLEEKGLDADTFHEQLQAAYEDALAQAVADGVITQDQADALLADGWGLMGGGFGGGPRGGGFRGGRGGRRGMGDCPMGGDPDTFNGSNFGRWNNTYGGSDA